MGVRVSEEISSKIKWSEQLMQFVLTGRDRLFDFTRYSVVPNVSWGLLNYEADLLCLSKVGVFHEIEIKISKADMVADNKKRHSHNDPLVGRLWFAVPSHLIDKVLPMVPEYAGLVGVKCVQYSDGKVFRTNVVRRPRPKLRNISYRKPTDREIIKFLRLGVLRMWSNKKERMAILNG